MCAALAAGGRPDALDVFNWWVASPGCSGAGCFTQVLIDGCDLYVQSAFTPPRPAQMFSLPQQDCQAVRGWVTNAQFLDALRTGCEQAARGEAFSIAVTGVYSPFATTNFCTQPTIQAVRTCLGGLLTRLTHTPWP
jgi:hypothetical protein